MSSKSGFEKFLWKRKVPARFEEGYWITRIYPVILKIRFEVTYLETLYLIINTIGKRSSQKDRQICSDAQDLLLKNVKDDI